MNRTHLDLFSGIGGFALACRWAGVETIGFAEIDDYASKVLAKNFPGVPNYGDVRNVPGSTAAWLVTGGFPCQPFSEAGKQGGASDDRWLWPEMARVIERTRPHWVLAENVPGIVSMELDTVLSDLERIGYTSTPIIIPACSVNSPHRRDRVWIVAHSDAAISEAGFQTMVPRGQWWDGFRGSGNVVTVAHEQTECGCCGESYCIVNDCHWFDCEQCTEENENYLDGDDGRWGLESGMGGRNDGLPSWMDGDWREISSRTTTNKHNRNQRLTVLGNAIVPQVAYQLIRFMVQAEDLG